MLEKDELEKARRDRQIAVLQMRIEELQAVVSAQTVLLDSLYKNRFADEPAECEALINGFLEDLRSAKTLDPSTEEAVAEQQTRITMWMERFRNRVVLSLLRGEAI
ncbi:hypothetical protein [Comamonas terrae]|uniref:Uncharacterized protein n=1 Tax=Comamonas terrae TaxID=673548 RepID=A0ABW5UKW2_9BURK|nr:hypothetical protein [Comamonas terrae]